MTVSGNLELASMRIRVPAPPAVPERPRLPLVALAAPVLAAGVLWAISGSPFAIVLGAVGPVVAFASYAAATRKARRMSRDLAAAYEVRVAFLRSRSAERLGAAVRSQRERFPSASELVAACGTGLPLAAGRWVQGAGTLRLTLGSGFRSSLCVAEDEQDPDLHRSTVQLAESLVRDTPIPIVVSVDQGVALIGPLAKSRPLARSLVLQAIASCEADALRVRIDADPASWSWCTGVTAEGSTSSPSMELIELAGEAHTNGSSLAPPTSIARIILATDRCELPYRVGAEVDLRGSVATVTAPDPAVSGPLLPDGATMEECSTFVQELRRGIRVASGVPSRVLAAELSDIVPRPPADRRSDALPAVVGMGAGVEPVEIDLAREGPHALVAGATGSGKSELLLTWLLSLAETQPPDRLAVLLVDFKGGATFDKLRALPHTVGVVTDLDAAGAERAMLSLAAEVRSRERVLKSSGVSEWVSLPLSVVLPRLVVAVDEFATLAHGHPSLAALFVDLAARGRSLGVHLILCTQRPTGVFTESLAANCPLRLCLRVNTESDRQLMCGAAGAELRGAPSGRAVLNRTGSTEVVQAAIVEDVAARVRRIAERWRECESPRRPWLDALPALITMEAARAAECPSTTARRGDDLVLGILDDPENQRQPALVFRPEAQGALLVLGGPRSGKTTLIGSVALQCETLVACADDVEGAWDAVIEDSVSTSEDEARTPLLIDDLDQLSVAFADEAGAQYWMSALTAIMRRAAARGRPVVVTAARMSGALAGISAAAGDRVLLRQASPHDHALAGLDLRSYDPRAQPGSGTWAGLRVQIAVAGTAAPARRKGSCRTLTQHDWRAGLAVVSGAPWRFPKVSRLPESALSEWRGEPDSGDIIVCDDPSAWLSRPSSLAAIRARRPMLFHECNPADFRAVLRTRIPPPALRDDRSRAWLSHPDGRVERVSIAA